MMEESGLLKPFLELADKHGGLGTLRKNGAFSDGNRKLWVSCKRKRDDLIRFVSLGCGTEEADP